MGNLFHFHVLKNPCTLFPACKNKKVLRVVKWDGKVIEFTSPVLVRDLLRDYDGFEVITSNKARENFLPLDYELKLGSTCYLVPSKAADHQDEEPEVEDRRETYNTVKRIKVVITKKQLEELLSKKISVDKAVFGVKKSRSSSSSWKPRFVPIPEEN